MLTTEELDILGLQPETRFISRRMNTIQTPGSVRAGQSQESESGVPIEVRPIQNNAELERVFQITYDAYLERGYCSPRPDGRLIHYPHLDHIPETTVLVAIVAGQIVGTNSWTLDGPQGLHVDSDFKAECDAIRREGRRLAASWRIATTNSCRNEKSVVMALIQETLWQFVDAQAHTSVFTFNPRHERIYQRLLNMKTVARSEGTRGLSNAPAVFMRMDLDTVPERWLRASTRQRLVASAGR